jgi:hypothetical protein
VLLTSPQRRRLRAGRGRRRVGLHRREHLPDEALGRPAHDPDATTGTDDAHELVGGAGMVRREHDPDARERDVELAVREGQRLGVRLSPLDVEPAAVRRPPARLEQRRREVRRDDACARERRGQRRVPRPGRDVEHPLPRPDPQGVDERGPEAGDDLARDRRVVAERPHRPVPSLQRAVRVPRVDGLRHVGPPRRCPGTPRGGHLCGARSGAADTAGRQVSHPPAARRPWCTRDRRGAPPGGPSEPGPVVIRVSANGAGSARRRERDPPPRPRAARRRSRA